MSPNKHTHRHEGELVVFLIGLTFNKLWRIDAWWPAFVAMPRMLAELAKDPESGYLGYRLAFGPGGALVVQYWSSMDKLYAYASDQSAAHRPAWAAFNRRVRRVPNAVGVWHETYLVDRAESMYVDTPVSGLSAATEAVSITREHARDRMAAGRTRAAS